jgi:hypothetical protein
MRSSGGRPTNPAWTIKRQVAFAPETWEGLKSLAVACSVDDQKIGPGQLAGFLVEEAVEVKVRSSAKRMSKISAGKADVLLPDTEDPKFRNWRMPDLFVGVAA